MGAHFVDDFVDIIFDEELSSVNQSSRSERSVGVRLPFGVYFRMYIYHTTSVPLELRHSREAFLLEQQRAEERDVRVARPV